MIEQYITLTESDAFINLPFGKFILPIDFSYDFGNRNLHLIGSYDTIVTSYDGNPNTNFASVPKVWVTSPDMADGVYYEEITGFYIQISNNRISRLFFSDVKNLGYVTELDVRQSEPTVDGLYCVTKHTNISYGGGMAHLNLKNVWNTDNKDCWYVQGTVLKRLNGVWSRHYTGFGFMSKGNMTIKNIKFDNCQFYLFSPFDSNGKIYTTTDNFSISNCVIKDVARVISSVNYGGINQSPNWFNNLQYYSTNGVLRFNEFNFSNNKISSIHSWIMCGFPPSLNTTIDNNEISDCHTIFCCFNFFVKNYASTNYFMDKMVQTITNNKFINIRPSENNSQTSIIRTSGMATITNNEFIDCSQQIIYLSGGDSTVSNNKIIKWNDGIELLSPVFLIKMSIGKNVIENNEIVAPMSTIVALEGTSNTVITNNTIVGLTRYRTITTNSTEIKEDRVYNVGNLAKFKSLVTSYDAGISNGNHVYFDKINSTWKKTSINQIGFIFSKNDGAIGTQETNILNNICEVEGITNISSRAGSVFKNVVVKNNKISGGIYLHTGITNIDNYLYENNKTTTLMQPNLNYIQTYVNLNNTQF